MNSKVSIIIPARNERHLQVTIDDLLAKAAGEVEILAVLDGYWPDPPLKNDPRVVILHRGEAQGMRPAINSAAAVATGKYLMKCDAHCIFAPGYDEALKADCDEDWLVVPTRHSIDAKKWAVCGPSGKKVDFVDGGFNYHYLTFPYAFSMYGAGLHGKTFEWGANCALNRELAHLRIDDLMSFQGSCWFQHKSNFMRLGPLDHANYGFYSESIEMGMRQWATGGRCVINKNTWYAHLHKGREEGRGFYLSLRSKRRSEAYNTDFWVNNRWPGAVLIFDKFIEKFWPLLDRIDPASGGRWPDDWREWDKHRIAFENRPPEAIPAHT